MDLIVQSEILDMHKQGVANNLSRPGPLSNGGFHTNSSRKRK